MQPPRPIRTPLTIVGIVSNVVVLILLFVLLFSVPRHDFPDLEKIVVAVRKIAETKKVAPDDLSQLLGKVNHSFEGESYWNGNGVFQRELVQIHLT